MKKILVFGTGDNMFCAYHYLRDNYHITAFIDNNKEKQACNIGGKPVIPMDGIKGYSYDYLIVTPTLHQEICQQLLAYGVPSEKILLLRNLMDYSQYKGTTSVAFCIQDGLSECLAAANYIWHFAKMVAPVQCGIDIYCVSHSSYAHFVFDGSSLIRHVHDTALENVALSDYDIVIRLNPYPAVLHYDDYFLPRLAPSAVDYVLACEKFRLLHGQFLSGSQFMESRPIVFQEIQGDNWLKALDVEDYLGIFDEYQYVLPLPKEPASEKCVREPFIILCSMPSHSVRDWPQGNWDALRDWLMKTYPNHWILDVVGMEDKEYIADWIGFGKKLRERFSLDKIAVLLRDNKLLIGTDSPLIHLRYAMHGGRSIVLFGPTSEKVWGCAGNDNLRGTGCKHWCEGVTEHWSQRCVRGKDAPDCMSSISVEWVMDRIHDVLMEDKLVNGVG